jgi:glutamate formiminotransferase/formiminotetrahydrofolate cyclodeaminase
MIKLTLMDFRQTPLPRVIELIRREAARYGAVIEQCELPGLIPQAVFTDSAAWYLSITNFDPHNLLESRIVEAEGKQIPLAGEEPPIPADATMHIALPDAQAHGLRVFAGAVAEPSVTPGGGAVSALVGGLSAALAEMSAGLTLGKRGYEETTERMRAIQSTAASLRARLLQTVDDEIEAFQQLMAALRLPQGETGREDVIQAAMLHATDIPVEVARLAFEALQLLEQAVAQGNHNTVVDVAVGGYMALAAIESAGLNVRSNLLGLTNADIVRRYTEEVERLVAAGRDLKQKIVETAEQRAGLVEDL